MSEQENGQMTLEDWFEQSADEFIEEDEVKPKKIEDKEDCKVCGDSGPCSACDRGIELAKQQGHTYRRKR